MQRILRHEVPVDDQVHSILSGPVLHVASRRPDLVEFWAEENDQTWSDLTVVGTGHEFPDGYAYLGTAMAAGGALVWHLLEVPS